MRSSLLHIREKIIQTKNKYDVSNHLIMPKLSYSRTRGNVRKI